MDKCTMHLLPRNKSTELYGLLWVCLDPINNINFYVIYVDIRLWVIMTRLVLFYLSLKRTFQSQYFPLTPTHFEALMLSLLKRTPHFWLLEPCCMVKEFPRADCNSANLGKLGGLWRVARVTEAVRFFKESVWSVASSSDVLILSLWRRKWQQLIKQKW